MDLFSGALSSDDIIWTLDHVESTISEVGIATDQWILHERKIFPMELIFEQTLMRVAGKEAAADILSKDQIRQILSMKGFNLMTHPSPFKPFKFWLLDGYKSSYLPTLLKNGMWELTDFFVSFSGEKALARFSTVGLADRVRLYVDATKHNNAFFAATGTITGVEDKSKGVIDISWDDQSDYFRGPLPNSIPGKATRLPLTHLTRPEEIDYVFKNNWLEMV